MATPTPNLGFDNFFSTTLSGAISASDTVIPLNAVPTASEGFLVIEPDSSTNREIIFYTSKGASTVTCTSVGDGRGQGGTSAISHSQGATVKMNVVAEMFEAIQAGQVFSSGAIGSQAYASGWTPIQGTTPNTVTANGNRSYDLVFNSVDLTSYISPGHKLKLTRTVTAPTQCTDLEAGSSQYYSKSSPAGMTFTDDFAVGRWIKLESYANGTIESRYNGTSGWTFEVESTGQISLTGFNAGAANYSQVISYASIPLNKWVFVSAQLDMSAFTATTTTSYIMFDGVDVPASVARGGTNPTALVQAGDYQIGAQNGGTFFDGKLGPGGLFSAKVTQATMRGYMSQNFSGSETSLISAYSFNNTINDLNTSNANNLTAQGSAVATNSDSPFAGGADYDSAYTAGTTEYAEVVSKTFSTNTTLVVRVPDGYAIPTSGGVSALSYSTQSNPLGWPGISNVLADVIIHTAPTTTSATAAAIPGATLSPYLPRGRTIKVVLEAVGMANSVAGNSTITSICQDSASDANRIAQINGQIAGQTVTNMPVYLTAKYYPIVAGAKTFVGTISAPGGGTTTISGATSLPIRLSVELV